MPCYWWTLFTEIEVDLTFDTIVEACSESLKNFEEVSIVFVSRSANSVAHRLAQAAYSMSGPREWIGAAPDFISCNLDLDKN